MSDQLITLFSEILEIAPEELNDNTSPQNTHQWDSLTAMHIIAALENEYNVRFNTQEILKMDSIGNVRNMLVEKGANV